MIPVWTERSDLALLLGPIASVKESCVFCGVTTDTWHENTNNPICIGCAATHKGADIPVDNGVKVRADKRAGTFDRGDSVRAN